LGYAYGDRDDIFNYYKSLYPNLRLDNLNVKPFGNTHFDKVYCVIHYDVLPTVLGFFIGDDEEIKRYYMNWYKINIYNSYGPKIIVTPLQIVSITKDDLIKKSEIDSELDRINKKITELQKYSNSLKKGINIPVTIKNVLFYGDNKPSRHRCKGCGKETSYADAHVIEGSMGNYYTC